VQRLVGRPRYPRAARPRAAPCEGLDLCPDGFSCRLHWTSMRRDDVRER
jgi:hypothetical protein